MDKRWIKIYRIFFSVPTLIFMFSLILVNGVRTDGKPASFPVTCVVYVFFYLIFMFPINLMIRLVERIVLKIPFSQLLERPLFHLFDKEAYVYEGDKNFFERLQEFKDGFSLKILWLDTLYFIDSILFPPAKVMFVIWTICIVSSYSKSGMFPVGDDFIGILIGYVFYCGLADLIYYAFQKKYYMYKYKVCQRHMRRLKKAMKKMNPDYYAQQFPEENVGIKNSLDEKVVSENIAGFKDDLYFEEAARLIVKKGKGSIGLIQRNFKLGFNRAARIMEQLELAGIVGPEVGTYPRQVLVDEDMLEYLLAKKRKMGLERTEEWSVQRTEDKKENVEWHNNYDSMSGIEFEQFCAGLLRRLNFVNVETTKASGDHGVDILAEKEDVTYAIQCKCYSSNIGNAAVQQALTGKKFYHRDVAVVLTNQYFTPQAKEEAAALGVKLWDRDKLNDMIRTAEER